MNQSNNTIKKTRGGSPRRRRRPIRREKSCGAVIFHDFGETRKVLLVKHLKSGHWSFPKGHMEAGESEEETALREIKEETGLTVTLDTSFRYVSTYSPVEHILKDVVYFAAYARNCNAVPQPEEIKCADWFDYACARATITHAGDRAILEAAVRHISEETK